MAQLYITTRKEHWLEYLLTDQSIIHHITRVLRMKPADMFFLQNNEWTLRVKVAIQKITKEQIIVSKEEEISHPQYVQNQKRRMIVAMPNKFEKLELIVQKLAEIGIDTVIFWPSRRSLLKDIPPKKMERLQIIAREATEQSWWRHVPDVSFSSHISFFSSAEYLLFDYHEHLVGTVPTYLWNCYKRSLPETDLRGIIWPEWWFDPEEIRNMGPFFSAQVTLGDTVLRMETAAIVAGRRMKHI